MPNFSKLLLSLTLLTAFIFSASALPAMAAPEFANPVIAAPFAGCSTANLQSKHFTSEMSLENRLKVCLALDKIANKLNTTDWSPALRAELKDIWQIFSSETVTLRLMPNGSSSRMLAMAEPFPSGQVGNSFEASVYVRPEKSNSDSFFPVLFHELRHVYDFYYSWKNKNTIESIELERRAFLLMGKLSQETPGKNSFSGVPKFWKSSWQNNSPEEIAAKRGAAVEKYLRGNKLYRDLSQSRQALDFSYLKSAAQTNQSPYAGQNSKKDGERLPQRVALPSTNALIPQKIQELDFDLEKPKNQRDEKEVLRVAIRNEKKLYYGMSNYVYDQKLQFQCWRKGKVVSAFSENNTIARTEKGDTLFQTASFQQPAATDCISNYRDLKTDFTETFWASPALEKMPITFSGFVEIGGKTLARYTVLQPDTRLYNQLAAQYGANKPFRVFVGTIFVSPEDGQIVKFWGTSFPEDSVTGATSKKVFGSYSVTAVRQRLNINGGVWITVHIGTVAVSNIGDNLRPFSYTVKFENYRQSATDVRILDDEDITAVAVK